MLKKKISTFSMYVFFRNNSAEFIKKSTVLPAKFISTIVILIIVLINFYIVRRINTTGTYDRIPGIYKNNTIEYPVPWYDI